MNKLAIKVCGMTQLKQVAELALLGVQYAGFIFYPGSPRYVKDKIEPEALRNLKGIKKVGVFVNASIDEIEDAVRNFGLDFVQLHGEETPDFCKQVAAFAKVIKVFRIAGNENLAELLDPYKNADAFLFDTKSKEYGGTGKKFDWSILQQYNRPQPYFLSGGIGIADIDAVFELANKMSIHALDVNSKFEIAPGIKNMELVKQFQEALMVNE